MPSNRRISERELVVPALRTINSRDRTTTSDLIKKLTGLLKPTGKDAELLKNRKDTKFSQKVRNLVSHRTLVNFGYATYRRIKRNGLHKITKKGQRYLRTF